MFTTTFVSVERISQSYVMVIVLLYVYDVISLRYFPHLHIFFTYMTKTYYDVCSYVCFYLQSSIYAENVNVSFPHS